ncbi:MAG: histidine kinase [Bacteroidetes bacterium]|nr:histidine kinase [Fibrella sp.]
MKSEEVSLKELLQRSRQQLLKPFAKTQRRLLFLLNVTYLCLTPIYLVSEKLATDHFVPHPVLGWVYALVGTANLLSAAYNYLRLTDRKGMNLMGKRVRVSSDERLDGAIRWSSVISVLIMSFCHMSGLGNPSSDAILTDFALGHSLIVLVAMLLGRPASIVWFVVVLGLLFYVSFFDKGYSYQYNYLTPQETTRYELALYQQKPWALARRAALQANGLNPPRISRYFNTWFVFILIAFLAAYFCLGITHDVFKVIPTVTETIKDAIETTKREELEREREKNQVEEQKLLLRQETLSAELKHLKAQINPHFLYNTLNYFYIRSLDLSEDLAAAILKLSDIMRYSMQENLNLVSLDEEINYMQQFIALHQLRNDNKLFIRFSVTGPVGEKRILPFLLIGLVENSFKHGKMNTVDCPLIIAIDATPDQIKFQSSNRKNQKKRVESNHIGLSNMRRRLDLTYETYSFEVDENEIDFSCTLLINT